MVEKENQLIQPEEAEAFEPLFQQFADLNFEHFRQRRQFQMDHDQLRMEPEYSDDKKKKLRTFYDLPDVSPIVMNPQHDIETEQIKAMKGIDWDKVTPEQKQTVFDNTRSIQIRKVTYDKPIAIIYNPNSGKKVNLLPQVEKKFKAEGIPFKAFGTTKAFDTFEYAKNLDLDKYSALVAIGGDGSAHEVFNGMLAQKNSKPIPFAIIPNGSGNDFASSLGIDSPTKAIDVICAKTTTMVDYGKMFVDVEDESEIPEGEDSWNYMRYFNNSIGLATVPRIAMGAKPYKACCGTGSYKIAAMKLACCSTMTVDTKIYVDGKVINMPKKNDGIVRTMVCTLLNSKWLGFMVSNPFGCINDGIMELSFMHAEGEMGLGGMGRLLKEGANGTSSVYRDTMSYYRGREFRFEKVSNQAEELTLIDGEDWAFKKFVKASIVPQGLECLFDAETFFKEKNCFLNNKI